MINKDILIRKVEEAIEYGKGRRFIQSIDLQVIFKGLDPKSPEARFRDVVYLPKGLGKKPVICVVADGEMALKAKEAADLLITREEIQSIDKKKAKKIASQCDWLLVKADLMGVVGRVLGPALGPRGKAPIPVPANADIIAQINYYRSATRLRNKEQPFVSCRVGTENMRPEDLAENIVAILNYLENKIKMPLEQFVNYIVIKTTMGPPVRVDLR
ncbi:MAG: 50S ribosomal protein L1 [Desulfurococcaceae archaeon]|nr:50S ribosomal protein L1 [Desulfurococcaceae archaeon]